MNENILKYALDNAVKHKGQANPGAIIGKLIAADSSIKSRLKELQPKIQEIVKQVNDMTADDQLSKLKELAPEMLEKKEKQKHDLFAFLKIQKGEKIITAFPPGPEKYPHIGHAKALFLNHMLAKEHDGRFILRFEDTNPNLVKEEFYEIMQENFKWLGVNWDKLLYASDYMALFHKHALYLIEEGHAYMCSCSQEQVSEGRRKSIPCACRSKPVTENLKDWDQFKVMKEGEITLRLKIDLEHKNSTMRDPALMRIIDAEHARHGKKFRLWPTYDFQNAIMDGESGITHRLRSKEFEMRNELQRYIQRQLGYKETEIYEFARFNLKGVESSGRVIREKINKGELIGWDDPTLTTIVALRRRGFLPEAIRNFVVSTGVSKAEATLTWDDLFVHNKRLLDAHANRYFFIPDPVEINIENAPVVKAEHKMHPDHPEKGIRSMTSKDRFFMAKDDRESLKSGGLYRFMDCLNFVFEGERMVFDSLEYEKYKKTGDKIMHYLPVSDDLVKVEVMMPDKTVVSGIAEPLIKDIPKGDVVQFERFGFCRLDEIKDDVFCFWFTHK